MVIFFLAFILSTTSMGELAKDSTLLNLYQNFIDEKTFFNDIDECLKVHCESKMSFDELEAIVLYKERMKLSSIFSPTKELNSKYFYSIAVDYRLNIRDKTEYGFFKNFTTGFFFYLHISYIMVMCFFYYSIWRKFKINLAISLCFLMPIIPPFIGFSALALFCPIFLIFSILISMRKTEHKETLRFSEISSAGYLKYTIYALQVEPLRLMYLLLYKEFVFLPMLYKEWILFVLTIPACLALVSKKAKRLEPEKSNPRYDFFHCLFWASGALFIICLAIRDFMSSKMKLTNTRIFMMVAGIAFALGAIGWSFWKWKFNKNKTETK